MVLAPSPALSVRDRAFLLDLQRQTLRYFLDNQTADGLVFDRQSNFGPSRRRGLCSLAATGMGFIALALASAPPFRLLPSGAAARRVAVGLQTVLDRLPHDQGVLPHFVDSDTFAVYGADVCSTVETGWIAAGALWAAAFLNDPLLEALANRLYGRINWCRWAAPNGLLRHGKGADRRKFACTWDRLNGETVFLYILAAGAENGRALSPSCWQALRKHESETGGLRFGSADLGLFVFQYGLDLLDLRGRRPPDGADLWTDAERAAEANRRVCRSAAERYRTYRRFWACRPATGRATRRPVMRTAPTHRPAPLTAPPT